MTGLMILAGYLVGGLVTGRAIYLLDRDRNEVMAGPDDRAPVLVAMLIWPALAVVALMWIAAWFAWRAVSYEPTGQLEDDDDE